jgi:hypothetical protein
LEKFHFSLSLWKNALIPLVFRMMRWGWSIPLLLIRYWDKKRKNKTAIRSLAFPLGPYPLF